MKKLNKTIHQKLILQGQEAKQLGLTKLADNVLNAVGPVARELDEKIEYSYEKLKNEIHQNLWKMAMDVISYYDLKSVDVQDVDQELINLTDVVLSTVEGSMKITTKVGPFEPLLPGENKK